MTAGVFAAHGVWCGTCRDADELNQKGYFENKRIRGVVMAWHKAIVHKGVLALKRPGFRDAIIEAITADGWGGEPWFWKGSVLYWPAFFEFTPKWVVCERPPEHVFTSCRRSGIFGNTLSAEKLRENIAFHQQQMDYLATCKQAVRVFTDDVAKGDYSSLARALQYCGVTPDYDIIDGFVERRLWHQ